MLASRKTINSYKVPRVIGSLLQRVSEGKSSDHHNYHHLQNAGKWNNLINTAQGSGTAFFSSKVSNTTQQQQQRQQQPIDSRQLYQYMKLESFSDEEFENLFIQLQQSKSPATATETTTTTSLDDDDDANNNTTTNTVPDTITITNIENFLFKRLQEIEEENDYVSDHDDEEEVKQILLQDYANKEAKRCWNFLSSKDGNENTGVDSLTLDELKSKIKDTATALDMKRVLPITLSMLLVGSSVGVVTPAMPFVVQNLGLTAGEYGLVVSAFALAKMTGNIPTAVLVERHGRKPYLVYSMAIIAMGVGGIGLAGSFEHLYLCRLFTGLGVAGLSTAATMSITDISTPLNRASTFAPIMSAFAAGTALGPALGGIMCDQIGINPTFYLVGVSYIGLAAVNHLLLNETKPRQMMLPWQHISAETEKQPSIRESFQAALGQWIPLLSETPIRNVCIMNGFYWIALSGSQMTLLPLILTDPNGLAMTATSVGQVYMGMSIVQVLGNPVLAKVVDSVGKVPGIVGGCTLISTSMATLPLCSDIYQMAGVLAFWAAGSSLLSTSPISFISDQVDDEKRAQAIALLRTSGDVGFLIGASTMGALADWAGSLDMAMQSSSAILLTATGWFAARNIMSSKLAETTKKE